MHWQRRQLLGLLGGCALGAAAPLHALPYQTLRFPRDHGAHPDFRTEWWYITGHAQVDGKVAAYGFQITFFRTRVASTQSLKSKLAARQLLFAHAAITDVQGRRLWHDQRIARWSGTPAGPAATEQAWASTEDGAVTLRDWSLERQGDAWNARIQAESIRMDLQFTPSQGVLLQGRDGLSRKGPQAEQASYYYTLPQLQAQGHLQLQGRRVALQAQSRAWLDHEWSQELLHPQAVGWDWIGINLLDGSALTAFRLRNSAGAALWAGGSFRPGPQGTAAPTVFAPGEVAFEPRRWWTSPHSGARYAVEWAVQTPVQRYTVRAVLDDQELDSRQSTGAIYWEGLCELLHTDQTLLGRGYLEMTGYAAPLKM